MINSRLLTAKSLVAVDLAACVVLDPRGLQRCLDTVFSACPNRDDEAGRTTPLLHHVYGALDRVLIAHITCDPFVAPTAGANELVRCLRRRRHRSDGLALAVATFSPSVMRATLRRFGWEDVFVVDPPPSIGGSTWLDGSPLWSIVAEVAANLGVAASDVGFVSDDSWEIGYAKNAGCDVALRLDCAAAGKNQHHVQSQSQSQSQGQGQGQTGTAPRKLTLIPAA